MLLLPVNLASRPRQGEAVRAACPERDLPPISGSPATPLPKNAASRGLAGSSRGEVATAPTQAHISKGPPELAQQRAWLHLQAETELPPPLLAACQDSHTAEGPRLAAGSGLLLQGRVGSGAGEG